MKAYKNQKEIVVNLEEIDGRDIITYKNEKYELEGPLEKNKENIEYVFEYDTKLYIENDNYIEVYSRL